MVRYLFLLLFILGGLCSNAQLDHQRVVQFSDSLLQYGISASMVPGAILSITSSDSIYLAKGYGYSNFEERIPVDPNYTLFQLGSVGKVFTAISALQQIEKGKLQLNKNVNDYLNGWQINNPYETDLTLFHLLTHTGGFNDHVIGYMARSEKEVIPLEAHLKKNLPSLFQAPGTNINYSNYGYALAGHLTELASNQLFGKYVQKNLFDPLHLKQSTYYLPDDYQEQTQYARGYKWRETFEEVKSYPRQAIPAGSIISTASDMVVFMQAILNRDTSLLSGPSYNYLYQQQFTNHELLTGYSLGMEIQNFNGHHAIGKGGQVPGFLSILMFFPEDDLGLFLSFNTETDNFLELFFNSFKKTFFPTTSKPEHRIDVDISENIGHYGNLRTNHETIEELFMLYEGHVEFFRSSDNNLETYHNGSWQEYIPIRNDVFQNKNQTDQFVVFERNASGNISKMYRNVVVGGIQIPASYRRLGWFERPRFINDEYPVLLMVIPSYLILMLSWIGIYFMRQKNPEFLMNVKISAIYHAAALLFLILFFWNIIGFFIPLLQNRVELFFDFNTSLLSMRYFNWAMATVSIGLLVLTIRLWFRREGNWIIRIYYSMYSLVCFSYILLLHRWHFLNITYQ